MNIGVLLAGSGVYDGSEIHEAVFTLLAIDELGHTAVCFAPDRPQHHVVNHLTGEETGEKRNMLVEAARIARGNIRPLHDVTPKDYAALVIPGGFGPAKNFNEWALAGPDGKIWEDVQRLIQDTQAAGKPIAGLCMGPTVLAKAFAETAVKPTLTVGSTAVASPYDIQGISDGMASLGATPVMKTLEEVAVDETHKLVTAPCYMLEGSVAQIRANIRQALEALVQLID